MSAPRHTHTPRSLRFGLSPVIAKHLEEAIMATQAVQQVVDYLKSHPDVAKKAMAYIKTHPTEVKESLRDVAKERGWDLSKIDTSELKSELTKLAH